ncbi:unnamed protein product, partial [Allacma fusca]
VIVNTRGIFGQGKFNPYNSEGLLFAIFPVVKENNKKYWLVQPPKFFLSHQYLHENANQPEKFQAYENYVWRVVSALHNSRKQQPLKETLVRAKIKEMIEFEVKLAEFVENENFLNSKSKRFFHIKKFYLHFPRHAFRKLVEIV